MRTWLLFFLLFLILSISHGQETAPLEVYHFTPRVIGIVAKDAQKSALWYQNNLGFELDTTVHYDGSGLTISMLHIEGFFLELIQFKQTYDKSDLGLSGPNENLQGIIKFGFKTKDLSGLYQKLEQQSVKIVAPLGDLPKMKVNFPWPKRHFIIEDPDGNYLQFFSSEEVTSVITPFMFTLAVDNLDKGITWYQDHLGFQLIDKISRPTNEIIILEKDGFILEMGRFDGYRTFDDIADLPKEITPNLVRGFYKVSMLTSTLKSLYHDLDRNGQSFSFELTDRASLTGEGYFMVEDPFGNALQFWGRKN